MTRSTCILLVLLTLMSVLSLFVGAADITPADVLSGDIESLELMLISRLPRLLAILCTGMGMSIAGLIMQQLCANKFVSPTTGATISSAQFGILIALLFSPIQPFGRVRFLLLLPRFSALGRSFGSFCACR